MPAPNPLQKKQSKAFSGKRLVHAVVKGVLWGWVLGVVVSGWWWFQVGFETANQRLVDSVAKQTQVTAQYHDTALFAWLHAGLLRLEHAMQAVDHSAFVKTAKTELHQGMKNEQHGVWAEALATAGADWQQVKVTSTQVWQLLKNTTLLVAGRLLLALLAVPLLALCWVFGVVDGFALREIRTAEFGRESSFIFHRFLGVVPTVLWWLLAFYLVSPWWLNPVMFFIGVGLMTWWLSARTVSKFKKYW